MSPDAVTGTISLQRSPALFKPLAARFERLFSLRAAIMTTEEAIDEIIVITLGLSAGPTEVKAFRDALHSITQLAIHEYDQAREIGLAEMRKAMSDGFEGDR